jgi:hypothetical protein
MVLSKANVHGSIRTRNSPNWVELRLVQAPGLAVSEPIERENPRPLRSTALALALLYEIRNRQGARVGRIVGGLVSSEPLRAAHFQASAHKRKARSELWKAAGGMRST